MIICKLEDNKFSCIENINRQHLKFHQHLPHVKGNNPKEKIRTYEFAVFHELGVAQKFLTVELVKIRV